MATRTTASQPGFCKITTDDGAIVGWSENSGPAGVDTLILSMGASLVGEDPRAVERISQRLRQPLAGSAYGGVAYQAVAAIENALIDIKGPNSRCFSDEFSTISDAAFLNRFSQGRRAERLRAARR